MKRTIIQSIICVLFLYALPMMASTRYHVNINSGDDANDGLSWRTAFQNLQTALDKAVEYDVIWIAAGTYHPTQKFAETYGGNGTNKDKPTTDRHRSFVIPKNVSLYGGFSKNPANTATLNSRNWKVNQTVLSGDFDNNDGDNFENMNENAFHVVILFDATPYTVLDGLYITGGCAEDMATVYPDKEDSDRTYYVTSGDGGGIYAYSRWFNSSPTISDVSFYGNYARTAGGGMFNYSYAQNASPKITNVFFVHNRAEASFGGGLYNNGGRSVYAYLSNVNVVGNASARSGGGLYFISIEECSPTIINTVVSGNFTRSGNGGGIYMTTYSGDAEPAIINSTICGNRAASGYRTGGGGLVVHPIGIAKPNIMNAVIWGNKAEYYDNFYTDGDWGIASVITGSLIEGLNDLGSTNLSGSTNPLFFDPVNADFAPTLDGDYQLTLESPLINKGFNELIGVSKDLLDNPRIFDGKVDIGAYESQGKTPVFTEAISDDSEKTIWSSGSNLYVRLFTPATLRVYAIDGSLVKHINNLGEGMYEYPLPQGIYIVTLSNGITEKIIIRGSPR